MRLDEDFIKKNGWFHSIDFGNGLISPPRSLPPNWTLYGVFKFIENIKVEGMECLDIGTFDGLTAFILKKLGAAAVTGSDVFDFKTFRAGNEYLNLDIEYISGTPLELLNYKIPTRKFDLVVMAGVLYHLYGPLLGIAICRKLTKRDGLFILETETYNDDNLCKESIMVLNSSMTNYYADPSTYWQPTVKCVTDMLKICCFEPLSVIRTRHRTSFMARAVAPDEISNKEGAIELIHSQNDWYRKMSPYPEYMSSEIPGYLNFDKIREDKDISHIKTGNMNFPSEIIPEEFISSLPFLPLESFKSK